MNKVFCFGELLLRLSPVLGGEWIRSNQMPVFVGGAELNVAQALSCWGLEARYVTALPEHYLSKEIVEFINSKGIDTTAIHYAGNRIGSYYLPQGIDMKNAGVIYDRAWSSFYELQPGQINWEQALEGCSWFHFSAISPALNDNVASVCEEGLRIASKKGMTISVDLNYRSKLWKYGKQPVEIMPSLTRYCNLVMGNIWSASDLLGIPVDGNIHDKKSKTAYLEHAGKTSQEIMKQYPSCETVANTFRFDEGKGIRYFASLDTKRGQTVSPEFSTSAVVDKVGSGDCFMGGLIYGMHQHKPPQEIIGFAAAAAFAKLQEKGDATNNPVEKISKILESEWQNTNI